MLPLLCFLHLTVTRADNQLLTLSHDNSDQCDCYLTSGPDHGYFQYYRFFDFRFISPEHLPASIPNLITSPDAPADPTDPGDLTSSYFSLPAFSNNWSIQNFSSADTSTSGAYEQVTTTGNIWVGSDCGHGTSNDDNAGTCLVLRTSRSPEFQSSIEIDCLQGNMYHASIRAHLRVVPTSAYSASGGGADNAIMPNDDHGSGDTVDSGAVVGFFTFGGDTSESDIEILTRDPVDHIRFSNQPDYDEKTDAAVPGASTNALMPAGKNWTQWITHRLDWFDGVSQYWVDDTLVLTKTKNVPDTPGGAILNVWGDGGEWSGEMRVGGEVRVEVAWIDMAFNVSGDLDGPDQVSKMAPKKRDEQCSVGCWVDRVEAGYPVRAFNATGNDGTALGQDGGVLKWDVLALGQVLVVSMLRVLFF